MAKVKQPIVRTLDTMPDGTSYSKWSIPTIYSATNIAVASGSYISVATLNLPPGILTRALATFVIVEVYVLWATGMTNTDFDVRWVLLPSGNAIAIFGARVDNGEAGSASAIALSPNVAGDNQVRVDIYQNTGAGKTISTLNAWVAIQQAAS